MKGVWEWLKSLVDKYLSKRRLLYPVLLFSGILVAIEILFWRIKLPTPIDREYFSLSGAMAGTTGYYLAKESKSKPLAIWSSVTAVLSFTIYRHMVEVLTDANLGTVLFLVFLCFVGCGALFMALRLWMNMGLK